MRHLPALLLFLMIALPQPAFAQVVAADSGDTGWTLVCSILLLAVALPGLMLRHAGQVNVRNALSVMAQGAGVVAILSLGWAIAGYSLVYAPGGAWLGGSANLMLANLAALREGLTIPESAFILFQMAALLVCAGLLIGAVAERTSLGWFLAFAPLWMLLVYVPIAHAVWAGGWLAALGVMDFAGALVVHATAGFSALALALIVGARREAAGSGHSPVLSLTGGALLWIGLSGLVGGWALGATDDAATALLNFPSLTPPTPTDLFKAVDLAVYAADRQRDELGRDDRLARVRERERRAVEGDRPEDARRPDLLIVARNPLLEGRPRVGGPALAGASSSPPWVVADSWCLEDEPR